MVRAHASHLCKTLYFICTLASCFWQVSSLPLLQLCLLSTRNPKNHTIKACQSITFSGSFLKHIVSDEYSRLWPAIWDLLSHLFLLSPFCCKVHILSCPALLLDWLPHSSDLILRVGFLESFCTTDTCSMLGVCSAFLFVKSRILCAVVVRHSD